MATELPLPQLVVIDSLELMGNSSLLSGKIEAAFGAMGLGIIAVRNVPGYQEARRQLLPLAEKLERLPEGARRLLEDPESRYSFGWSFGKESLEGGRKDTLKGSFYANPVHDRPTEDAELMRTYPTYCRPNLWPTEHLPELEPAFKRLGQIVVDVGSMLVAHCDHFVTEKVQQHFPDYPEGTLTESLRHSRAHKGRLLVYMPDADAGRAEPGERIREDDAAGAGACAERIAPSAPSRCARDTNRLDEKSDALGEAAQPLWCAWHLDHGSITGLTRAQYRCTGEDVASPDPLSGLYVRLQDGREVQVAIPEDCIAFQMGQAMSIMSGGLLCATPHCVKAPMNGGARRSLRTTFAVFMQPTWNDKLVPAPGAQPSETTKQTWGPWQPGMTFGEFSKRVVEGYYGALDT